MSATKAERLQRLHRRATCYEIVARVAGQEILIGYARRHGRDVILGMVMDHPSRPAIIEAAGGEGAIEAAACAYTAARGWTFTAADGAVLVQLCRSGRTEREAITAGELPEALTATAAKSGRSDRT